MISEVMLDNDTSVQLSDERDEILGIDLCIPKHYEDAGVLDVVDDGIVSLCRFIWLQWGIKVFGIAEDEFAS